MRLALLALAVRTPLSRAAACFCASPAADDELAGICASEVDDICTPLSKAAACACASGERDAVLPAPAGPLTVAAVATIIEIISKRDFIIALSPVLSWRTRGAPRRAAAVRRKARLEAAACALSRTMTGAFRTRRPLEPLLAHTRFTDLRGKAAMVTGAHPPDLITVGSRSVGGP